MQSYLEMLETEFLSASSNMDKIIQSERLEAMRQVELIGMTTSAAARLYPLLCELRCPIGILFVMLEHCLLLEKFQFSSFIYYY